MTHQDLEMMFNGNDAHIVKRGEQTVGRALFETQLEEHGFTKSELRKLVACSILKKLQVRLNGALRNSYVLLSSGAEGSVQKRTG